MQLRLPLLIATLGLVGCEGLEVEHEGEVAKTSLAATATAPTCTEDVFPQADPGAGFLALKNDGTIWMSSALRPAVRMVSLGNDNKALAENSGQAVDYCVIKTDDSLWCWGPNRDGVVGTGDVNPVDVAQPVMILEDVAEAEMARYWACARKNDGTVWCWGNVLETGIIGDGNQDPGPPAAPINHTPTQVALPGPAAQLATGFSHAFARLNSGQIYGWGAGSGYCLGLGNFSDPLVNPTLIDTLGTDNRHISAGSFSGMVVKNDGRVLTWGYASGAGGPPTEPIFNHHEVTAVGRDILTAETRMHQNCVITNPGALWCWGDENPDAQLGNASADPEDRVLTPEPFAGGFFTSGSPVRKVRTVKSHTCVILEDESLWCLGAGGFPDGEFTAGSPVLEPTEQDWCNNCDPSSCEFVCDVGQCVMCTNNEQCGLTPATPFCNTRTGTCQETDPGLDTNSRVSGCGGGARCTAAAGRGPARFGAWTVLLAAFVGLGAFRRHRRRA